MALGLEQPRGAEPEPYYLYPAQFVEQATREYIRRQGNFYLTGSWVGDLEQFPGFWDLDFPICYTLTMDAREQAEKDKAKQDEAAGKR